MATTHSESPPLVCLFSDGYRELNLLTIPIIDLSESMCTNTHYLYIYTVYIYCIYILYILYNTLTGCLLIAVMSVDQAANLSRGDLVSFDSSDDEDGTFAVVAVLILRCHDGHVDKKTDTLIL